MSFASHNIHRTGASRMPADYGHDHGKMSLRRRAEKREIEGLRVLAVKKRLRIIMRALHAGVSVEEMQGRISASMARVVAPPAAPLPESDAEGTQAVAKPKRTPRPKSPPAIKPPVLPVKRAARPRRAAQKGVE